MWSALIASMAPTTANYCMVNVSLALYGRDYYPYLPCLAINVATPNGILPNVATLNILE